MSPAREATVEPAALRSLVAAVPAGAPLAVTAVGAAEPELGADLDGHTLHRIPVDPSPRGPGGDPDDGLGALDRLTLARARGATHLVVPTAVRWCLDRYPELAEHLRRTARVVTDASEGTLWALAPPPPPGSPTVFCIGLNKTGTSSLHLALTELGLRSHRWGDRAAYHAVLEAQRDGERLLHHLGEDDDAYSDIGTLSVRFDIADVQYPGSRFVLTVRDVDEWVDSRRRHAERNASKQLAGTYRGSNVDIDEVRWRAQWQAHLDRVTTYFERRDDLLVLDICAGEGWDQLAPFLGHAVPTTPFPRENVDQPLWFKLTYGAWRASRRRLPDRVAGAISTPPKRVLQRLGVLGTGRLRPPSGHDPAGRARP